MEKEEEMEKERKEEEKKDWLLYAVCCCCMLYAEIQLASHPSSSSLAEKSSHTTPFLSTKLYRTSNQNLHHHQNQHQHQHQQRNHSTPLHSYQQYCQHQCQQHVISDLICQCNSPTLTLSLMIRELSHQMNRHHLPLNAITPIGRINVVYTQTRNRWPLNTQYTDLRSSLKDPASQPI